MKKYLNKFFLSLFNFNIIELEMYHKKEGIEKSFADRSSMLIEESDSISSLVDEDDNDRDKRLDETDFINYFDEDYSWLDVLIMQKLLGKINEPGSVFQDFSGPGYDYEPYERKDEQVPYVLRDLNKEEEDSKLEKERHPLILTLSREEPEQEEEESQPEKTADFEPEIEERKAA